MLSQLEEIKKRITFEIKKNEYYATDIFDLRIRYPYSNCSFFLNLEDLKNLKEQVDLALKKENKKVKVTTSNEKKKYLLWKDQYKSIDWEKFRDTYFKCPRCGVYDNEQCICYAR